MQLHDLLFDQARVAPDTDALSDRKQTLSYAELATVVHQQAALLIRLSLKRQQRLAVYLPKQIELVTTLLATSTAGGVFVPINPLLKPDQVAHILRDCAVSVLVTSSARVTLLQSVLETCPDLETVLRVEDIADESSNTEAGVLPISGIDTDMAAILYTSGSTGQPKGVILSHRNLVCGASSVTQYLNNTSDDRILAVLPFSFDYGLNQLTTALKVGACCILMDYLLPRDVIKAVVQERITGLAAVPPLWIQLAQLEWPQAGVDGLRYITNSGGKMPVSTTSQLQIKLKQTDIYLMYGLTEAFRSTYLAPEQLSQRPDSIGKAIPNAEILVVRSDGTLCDDNEPGELVHRGSLVAMGYWNDVEKTAQRFKPCPNAMTEIPHTEMAVWSGDTVSRDEAGYLYFLHREDDMIKTSGYRVSPTEVESVLYQTDWVDQVAVLGVPHPVLGEAIVAIISVVEGEGLVPDLEALTADCKKYLPNFMLPAHFEIMPVLPRTPNGKIDRKQLQQSLTSLFQALD